MANRGGYRIDFAKVRSLRVARGWQQFDLARYSGVTHIARIETGKNAWVNKETVEAIAAALDVPWEGLVVERRGRTVLTFRELVTA